MRRNVVKICSVLLMMLFMVTETSYALNTVTSNTSGIKTTMIENQNPNPPVITGPINGKSGKFYNYYFLLTDPDGDDLTAIRIDWGGTGAGNTTYICWTCGGGNKPNGTIFVQSHSWSYDSTFTIRAKIYDTSNNESNWGTLTVTMPSTYNIPFQSFWERLFERFPFVFPILRHLMGY